MVDKEVRNALEIPKDKLTIDNSADWAKVLTKAVQEASAKLAPTLSHYQVTAELYKLVVYEDGGMFKPHRDTQRSESHFGTLVILLPGKAAGGDLVVRHGGEEETFSIPTGKKKCTWVAYFADVEHEVKPVTKGRRVSLLYHLHRTPGSNPVKAPAPTSVASTSASASSSAKGKRAADPAPAADLPPIVAELKKLVALNNGQPPAKKQKGKKEVQGKGKGKEDEEKEEEEDDEDDDGQPKFVGYLCDHSYAGELKADKLKEKDAAFYNLFAPHFPGTRIAHIEIRVYGPGDGDDGRWIKSPRDLVAKYVEVDEVEIKSSAPEGEGGRGWGELTFSKQAKSARLLCSDEDGRASDYGYDDVMKKRSMVRFLNDNEDIVGCAVKAKASDKSVAGSGNEGSGGAFLYKRAAVLVPVADDAEASLGAFSAKHAQRSHPSFTP